MEEAGRRGGEERDSLEVTMELFDESSSCHGSKQGETLQVEAERMGRKLPSASSLFPWDATMLALKGSVGGASESENGKCESESAQTSAEPSSK